MKILILGSENKNSIENYYLEKLTNLHVNATLFSTHQHFLNYYHQSIFTKIKFKLGLSKILNQINNQVVLKVDEIKPDIIWIFKGMEIFPDTLLNWKKQGIKLINYNPDNPFIFSGRGSGNSNITKAISFYDIHFTYSQEIKNQIEQLYGIETHILPFGFFLENGLYESFLEIEEVKKVCFLGNPDKYRARFIKELAHFGLEIDVYGHNWSKFINHKNVIIHTAVYEAEMWTVLRKYRVQLNYMRPHNLDSHNMRSFEIPAIGGIQVAPYTPDHKIYFDENENIFLYNNVRHCYNICNQLIEMDEKEVQKIRLSARDKSINSKYSYFDRAEDVFKILKSKYSST